MASNGRIPDSQLDDIPGGRLTKPAAASWLRLRARIGKEAGVWICPTSSRTAYRTYAEQQYFWNLYTSGRGALAARPGTSNHGWGVAVDVPAPRMAQLINRYGAEYGWQKRWSDAPSEWWHFKYAPQNDRHKGESPALAKKKQAHPYHVLTADEKEHRNILVKERRSAKRHGGWEKIDPSHLKRASEAKRWLANQAKEIREAAAKDGWSKNNRRRRYDYIRKLVKGTA
jgi:D-alanyl-D-alanine carboxypeptidase